MVQLGSSSSTVDRSARLQQSRAQLRRTQPPAKQTFRRNKFGGDQLSEIPNTVVPPRLPLSQEEREQQEFNQLQQLQQSRSAAVIKQTMARRSRLAQEREEREEQEKTSGQEEQKKKQQAALLNGSLMAMSGITTGLDAGSGGTSFLFTLIFRLPTLLWRNIQMICGTYFFKGKNRYITPLSWDPIPMPVDKEALILSGFIIATDIALALALIVLMFGGFCIVHDVVQVMSSPIQTGISLAQGGSGMCLGGIISSIFGL